MDTKQCEVYLLSKTESTKDFPFGPDAAVFRIKGKMFAIMGELEGKPMVNLKCDPDEANALRDIFPSIIPGYHMNKQHWNTVFLDGSIPNGEMERMIDNSYDLIVKSLPKKVQVTIVKD